LIKNWAFDAMCKNQFDHFYDICFCCVLTQQERELNKQVQSAKEAEWEKITQLEQAKLQVRLLPTCCFS